MQNGYLQQCNCSQAFFPAGGGGVEKIWLDPENKKSWKKVLDRFLVSSGSPSSVLDRPSFRSPQITLKFLSEFDTQANGSAVRAKIDGWIDVCYQVHYLAASLLAVWSITRI